MQLNRATNAFDNAKQQLAAVKQQVANALASLGNNADIMVDDHPIVQQAQAQLDKAKLDLSYTTIIAPIDGIVTKVEQIQRGDYINTGAPVFSLISNKNVWVEANFKETQMTYMHPGQEATFEIDAYPDKDFKGHVISTSPGTGASFSLLPPENATGNWVKIVQRVPVRISIDYNKDMQLLSSGLSVNVTVDTEHSRIFSANDR
jgi:membrane fusion protein (multidrug efflux system)